MSDDRTQAPSKRRRIEARERGMVARSPMLTAAVGLIAAVAMLGAWGGALGEALVQLYRAPLETDPMTWLEGGAPELVDRLRAAATALALPLGSILGGTVAAMLLAHGLQTGGLWAPTLLAPDLARLWRGPGAGGDPAERTLQGLGQFARSILLIALAAWLIRGDLPRLETLAHLEPTALARSAGSIVTGFGYAVGLGLLALGVADFTLSYRRIEARLLMTPQEQRAEQKSEDGDPELRARRRRLALNWRQQPTDALAGASLLLAGRPGPAVLLGGSPPPGQVSVRLIARGPAAPTLRRAADRAGLAVVDAPDLAAWFAARARTTDPLPADLAERLASLWPVPTRLESQDG